MKTESFIRAKQLEETLHKLNIILKIDPEDFRISEHSFNANTLKSYDWTHIVPMEIVLECLEVVKKHRDKCQKEFDELFAEVKQEDASQLEEFPKNVDNVSALSKKPWYKFW